MNIVDEAAHFAVDCHSGQVRKMHNVPFVLHPMEVAAIAATMTEERETIAAALLHDVPEDCGVGLDEIRARFGDRVAYLVECETEDKMRERPAGETWKERKEKSLVKLIESSDRQEKILWLSDKLANARSFSREYDVSGDGVWNHLHNNDKTAQEWYYRTVADAVSELSDTAAYKEYVTILDKLFG